MTALGVGQIVSWGSSYYLPAVLAKPAAERMVELISTIARDQGVGVFHRFALMRGWHESAYLPFSTFVTADHLHMNDWGYDCIARQIAGAIGDAAPGFGQIASR